MIEENYQLYHGDCLEVMKQLIETGVKVDAIICDPPYSTTSCKWDNLIPLQEMWDCLNALIKDTGAIVLFSQEPFTSQLIQSNLKDFRYKQIWVKNKTTGFPMANYRPLKCFDIVLIELMFNINCREIRKNCCGFSCSTRVSSV